MIRFFDFLFSFLGLLILFPVFLLIGLFIVIDSSGGVFYRQIRVGQNGKDFKLFKFRSMRPSVSNKNLITVGEDNRITHVGSFLRKYKLDELPQLINVLKGEMSIVGPRPEVRKYVDHYTNYQMKVLEVKPGITDKASIEFRNENEILSKADDWEKEYIENVMPTKIQLNQYYLDNYNLKTYFLLIFQTFRIIFR